MNDKLTQLAELTKLLVESEREYETAEAELKRKKEDTRRLREEAIPLLMAELGVSVIGLEDGTTIKVSKEVYASIANGNKYEAFKWLESNGFGGLIKTDVIISFPRDDRYLAIKWNNFLKEKGLTVDLNESVHPQTLKAFLKEQMRDGINIPLNLFGAMPVDVAKITRK